MNPSNRIRLMKSASYWCIVLSIGTSIIAFIGTGASNKLRQDAFDDSVRSTLRQGFFLYEKQYGWLPPGNSFEIEMKPTASWRVKLFLIIDPYTELTRNYRFGEQWNSAHNSQFHDKNYNRYHCPFDSSSRTHASYVRISGPNTPFPDDRAVSMAELGDNSTNTILAVDMHDSGIHWMEPRDITLEQAVNGIRQQSKPYVQGCHSFFPSGNYTNAVFADGSVRRLNSNIDPKLLRSLLEIDNPDKPKEKYISRAVQ